MARYRKSEYRTERRAQPKEKVEYKKICQGDMGLCTRRKVTPCSQCRRPYCEEHYKDHPKYCMGIRS